MNLEPCALHPRCVGGDARTCVLQGSGCDLRSSEAYFVARGVYSDYVQRLQQGVVDFDVLQTFDKMALVTPMVRVREKSREARPQTLNPKF